MVQEIVGSKMAPFASQGLKPDPRGYGQNGFGKASSDVPGENTVSGFMPATDLKAALTADIGGAAGVMDARGRSGKGNGARNMKQQPPEGPQTRTVGGNVAPAFGMSTRSPRGR